METRVFKVLPNSEHIFLSYDLRMGHSTSLILGTVLLMIL